MCVCVYVYIYIYTYLLFICSFIYLFIYILRNYLFFYLFIYLYRHSIYSCFQALQSKWCIHVRLSMGLWRSSTIHMWVLSMHEFSRGIGATLLDMPKQVQTGIAAIPASFMEVRRTCRTHTFCIFLQGPTQFVKTFI